ncbi:hypothetical protein L596_024119 [Steinernema carpocapsae]|uniref:BAAT/Acyl-CoA thioester hydrolase C-terminal domain-containing protein n=1 Tax=Steinernema carpocapsae TaxID=34508 RepID=A0A4U5MFR9_STECR|nr:hypothetical protein L596_024119 [Steinernema carpocapsae]
MKWSVNPSTPTLLDANLEIAASGLPPNEEVRVTLTLLHSNAQFQSFAKFVVPGDGVLDFAKTASFEGTYTECDGMGLFSSMCLMPSQRLGTVLSFGNVEGLFLNYQLHVYDRKNRLLGQQTLQKFILDPNVERREIAVGRIRGVLFKPRGAKDRRFPTVIDLFGLGGGCREYRAALLASKGFAVLALALYSYRDLPKFNTLVHIEYMKEAIDWILGQPFSSSKCSILAHSFGAIVGYQTVVRYPGISSMVALNGLPYVDGFGTVLENGKTVPSFPFRRDHAKEVVHMGNVTHYSPMWDVILDNEAEEVAKFRIPLESAPEDVAFMIVSSGDDRTNCYKRVNKELVERLKNANPRRRVDSVLLPNSGHMIDPPHMPHIGIAYTPPVYWAQGGHQYLQCVEQRQLWPQIIAFLRETIPADSMKEQSKL